VMLGFRKLIRSSQQHSEFVAQVATSATDHKNVTADLVAASASNILLCKR